MENLKLKNEITSDPENLGYTGKTDKEITDLLNLKNRNGTSNVNKDLVVKYLIRKNKWIGLVDSTEASARNIMGLILNTSEFDTNKPNYTSLLDDLVTLNLLDETNKTAIQEMGQKQVSRAKELGLGRIREGHVGVARS